MDLSFKLRIL